MTTVFNKILSDDGSSLDTNIFSKVINKKTYNESPYDFKENLPEDKEAKELIDKELNRPEKPIKALARGAVEGLGVYGNISSLLHGGESGEEKVAPGEKARLHPEIEALKSGDEKEFAKQAIANAAESDLAPSLTRASGSEDINKMLNMVGIPKEEKYPSEKLLGRGARLFSGAAASGAGAGLSLSTAATGSIAGQLAEEMGYGPTGQAVAETAASLRLGRLPPAQQATRIRQPRIVTRGLPPGEAGEVTARRVGNQLRRINDEAGVLAQNIGVNNRPFQTVSRAIESGQPIQRNFDTFFNGLENITYRFNSPLQDTAPLDTFINNEMRLYQGTGAPTFMGNLITNELQGWQQSGQNGLYNLFRRYRLNNQRIREIITDQNFPPAFRNQAIGFFTRMNEAISQSFASSLPQNSRWLQAFNQSNAAYSTYMNTLQVRRVLQPLIHGDLTPARLTRTLNDERFWESVNRFLGPDESQNLRQLLTDLQTGRNGLQSMRRAPGFMNTLMRHGLTRLAGRFIGTLFNVPSAWRYVRGRYYSSPEFQHTFSELTVAITERNVPAIVTAANKISEGNKKSKSRKTDH